MDIWSVLEILPTDDITAIKKAYARKLKLHHPEEDPIGYQNLREAYDAALKLAKNKAGAGYKVVPAEETDIDIDSKRLKQADDEGMNRSLEDFFVRIHNLYKDFHKRVDIKSWQEILSADILWDLDYKSNISKGLVEFILDYPNIPKEIWQELNKTFHWNENENYLRYIYGDSPVNFLLKQINNEVSHRYQYISKKEGIDYDAFLEYRRLAFYALENDNLLEAKKYISLANDIFQEDPDLICMKAEVYIKKGYIAKAKSAFKVAININSKDKKTDIYIAVIYYKYGYYKEAVNICKRLLMHDSSNVELRLLLGKFYLGSERVKHLIKAQYIFMEGLKLENYAGEAREYINSLIKKYEAFYAKTPWNPLIIKNLKKLYLTLGKNKKAEQVKFKLRSGHLTPRYRLDSLRFLRITVPILLFIYAGISGGPEHKTIPVTVPNAIDMNISVKNVTARNVEIAWNKIPGAQMYRIYRYDKDYNRYVGIGVTEDTVFSESRLEANTQYQYVVVCVNSGKEFRDLNPVQVKTELIETIPIGKELYSSITVSKIERKNINYGNIGNNTANANMAAGSGDWIYFADKDRQNSLNRMKKDGTALEKLRDGYISNLSVVGDWIYFTDSYKICRMRTDGSEYGKVGNASTSEFIIIGDWIYYENSGLNKMRLDGSQKSKIIRSEVAEFNIDGDWIYYTNINDKNKLYKARLDGSKNIRISKDDCGQIGIFDGWIYYTSFDEGRKLYKIRPDGTGKSLVSNNNIVFFNFIGDNIIYEASDRLYIASINGENETAIASPGYSYINVVDDYVFSYNRINNKVFIIKFKAAMF